MTLLPLVLLVVGIGYAQGQSIGQCSGSGGGFIGSWIQRQICEQACKCVCNQEPVYSNCVGQCVAGNTDQLTCALATTPLTNPVSSDLEMPCSDFGYDVVCGQYCQCCGSNNPNCKENCKNGLLPLTGAICKAVGK